MLAVFHIHHHDDDRPVFYDRIGVPTQEFKSDSVEFQTKTQADLEDGTKNTFRVSTDIGNAFWFPKEQFYVHLIRWE